MSFLLSPLNPNKFLPPSLACWFLEKIKAAGREFVHTPCTTTTTHPNQHLLSWTLSGHPLLLSPGPHVLLLKFIPPAILPSLFHTIRFPSWLDYSLQLSNSFTAVFYIKYTNYFTAILKIFLNVASFQTLAPFVCSSLEHNPWKEVSTFTVSRSTISIILSFLWPLTISLTYYSHTEKFTFFYSTSLWILSYGHSCVTTTT